MEIGAFSFLVQGEDQHIQGPIVEATGTLEIDGAPLWADCLNDLAKVKQGFS